MSTYRITYRKLSGQTGEFICTAASESEARNAFYAKYDGRIITVEVL